MLGAGCCVYAISINHFSAGTKMKETWELQFSLILTPLALTDSLPEDCSIVEEEMAR